MGLHALVQLGELIERVVRLAHGFVAEKPEESGVFGMAIQNTNHGKRHVQTTE